MAGLHDHIFDIILFDCLLLAKLLFCVLASIIAILRSRLTLAAVSDHHFPAIAAKQLRGQEIFFLASAPRRGSFVLIQDTLHPLEQLIADDARHTARRLLILIDINTGIAFVPKHPRQAVFVEFFTLQGSDLTGIQVTDDIGNCLSVSVTLKYFPHIGCCLRVDLETLLAIDLETKPRPAAKGQTLFCV